MNPHLWFLNILEIFYIIAYISHNLKFKLSSSNYGSQSHDTCGTNLITPLSVFIESNPDSSPWFTRALLTSPPSHTLHHFDFSDFMLLSLQGLDHTAVSLLPCPLQQCFEAVSPVLRLLSKKSLLPSMPQI